MLMLTWYIIEAPHFNWQAIIQRLAKCNIFTFVSLKEFCVCEY
jgi:hypothetical protein